MSFEEFSLPNGLRVLFLPDNSPSVTVLGLVKTGSRYESKKQEGLAHFYEHMVFKGTKKFPSKKSLALVVDQIGAECNGATGQEYTYYYVKTAKKDLILGLDLISQLLVEPLLSEKEIEVERRVILEELHMYHDVPQYRAQIELVNLLFPNHPLGNSGIGKEKTITSFDRKDFLDFKNNFYNSEKMVLVISGGMGKAREVKKRVEERFSLLKGGKKKDPVLFEKPKAQKNNKNVFKETDQVHLAMGVRGLSYNDKKRYAQSLVNIILGKGMSSRLFQEIREKQGLCYSISSSIETFNEVGAFEITAGINKVKLPEAIKAIKNQLFLMTKKEVDGGELAKAQNFFEGKLALSLEDSYEKAFFYGKQALLESNIKDVCQVISMVKRVDISDILLVSKELFLSEKIKIALVGDCFLGEKTDEEVIN
ncbi:MAG: peptidase M16 domain-containing protein [Microgenomates bacterium 39_6]|nr:MAG: peptidase M16 domain-containing protein [Microgenomates bacterium 39_6]